MVFTPVSLGPDTDDEETLVDAEVYINGECEVCVCSFSLRCAHCRAPIHVRKETHIYTRILYTCLRSVAFVCGCSATYF